MRTILTFAAALLISASIGQAEELPYPGYPPKMGDLTGTLGGVPVAWESYDFSVGAFDASAWAGIDPDSKKIALHLMAYPVGKPDEKSGRIYAKGETGGALKKGKARQVEVMILKGDDIDGPRLSSEGQKASLRVTSIGPHIEDSYSRRVTGEITARLCPVDWAEQSCQDLALRFDTDVQIESNVRVRP